MWHCLQAVILTSLRGWNTDWAITWDRIRIVKLTCLRMFSHVYFVLNLVLMWRRWSRTATAICHSTLNSAKTAFIVWILPYNGQDLKSETLFHDQWLTWRWQWCDSVFRTASCLFRAFVSLLQLCFLQHAQIQSGESSRRRHRPEGVGDGLPQNKAEDFLQTVRMNFSSLFCHYWWLSTDVSSDLENHGNCFNACWVF